MYGKAENFLKWNFQTARYGITFEKNQNRCHFQTKTDEKYQNLDGKYEYFLELD